MSKQAWAFGALLLLSACGEQRGREGAGKQSAGNSGSAAAGAMQPGQWEVTDQMVSMNIPGAPAAAQQLAPPTTRRRCITAEDTANMEESFAQANPEQCPKREFSMGGGRIKGQISCTQDGEQSSTTLTGEYTARSFDMRTESKTPGAPGQTITAVMRSTGRWIGECPPGAAVDEEAVE